MKGNLLRIKNRMISHAPAILIGFGVTGMIVSTVLAVKETPKALKLIEEYKQKNGQTDISVKEAVNVSWKCYIPSAVTSAVSIGCIIGANSTHARRNAALAAAYKFSETAFKEYKSKVVETIGEKKEVAIRDAVIKDRVKKDPIPAEKIIRTGRGDTLFRDYYSGREFTSDIEFIRKQINELNRRMISDMSVSLNEFYNDIDLSGIGIGDDLGWNIDDGYIDLRLSAQVTDDERPCLVLEFNEPPRYNYRAFY